MSRTEDIGHYHCTGGSRETAKINFISYIYTENNKKKKKRKSKLIFDEVKFLIIKLYFG